LFLVVAARAILWIAWFVGLVLWMPRIERVFMRFNVVLPFRQFMRSLTHGEVPLALLLSVVFIILDWSVSSRLRGAGAMAIWSGLMTLAPLTAIILTALALSRSMLFLLDIISRQ
jgi:hypothetical protein